MLTRIMSDLLEVDDVNIIKCEYYSGLGRTKARPVITQSIRSDIAGKRVLVIDDVADTGNSLQTIGEYLESKKAKSLRVATLYVKPWSKAMPHYYVSTTSAWIIFPWELHESLKLLSTGKFKASLSSTHIPRKYAKMLFKIDDQLARLKSS